MWLRFQIGSNRPLAKRKARMFCAASLPRKWSMRKIWLSSNVSCRACVQPAGAGQVGAERLLHDDPAALDEAGVGQRLHRGERRVRRDAEVVQPAGLATERVLGRLDGRAASASAPSADGTKCSVPANSAHSSRGHLAAGEHLARGLGHVAEALVVEVVERRADDPAGPAASPARCRCSRPGQQLALGQIAGRAEQHDDLRLAAASSGWS